MLGVCRVVSPSIHGGLKNLNQSRELPLNAIKTGVRQGDRVFDKLKTHVGMRARTPPDGRLTEEGSRC